MLLLKNVSDEADDFIAGGCHCRATACHFGCGGQVSFGLIRQAGREVNDDLVGIVLYRRECKDGDS